MSSPSRLRFVFRAPFSKDRPRDWFTYAYAFSVFRLRNGRHAVQNSGSPMPNCDFYALAPDLVEVLDFVFAQPGWMLVELASRPDHPLREFRTTQELKDGFPGFDSLSESLHFHLYSPSMGGRVGQQKITFNPGAVPGATFRYDSEGWGLVQLSFGRLREKGLSLCHTNHNTETRARKWEPTYADRLDPVDTWNWGEVTRISARLNRFIRGLSVAKVEHWPCLPAAWKAHREDGLVLARI